MIRRLAHLPPREWPGRAIGRLRREGGLAWGRAMDRVRPSYSRAAPGALLRILPAPPLEALRGHAPELAAACARDLGHVFDLLGSGPVRVVHGMAAAGLAGHRDHAARGERINAANRDEARRIRGLIGAGYTPIDWQLDFRGGFRWDESTWWRDVPIGHLPGVDVKVPWELSRMQHLPRLACAHALAAAGEAGFEAPERYAREFRDQVLDWIAANPPRWGVNWRMPMDVALRVVSWLVAYDLFVAQGVRFDDAFDDVFRRSVHEHALHVIGHLEWNREVRGNHYLANVAGVLFCAAYLPRSPGTDAWLAWAAQELGAETALQFTPDGASFEASTAYHCLSMEMVAWCTALLRGLPPEKARALRDARPEDWRHHPPLVSPTLPPEHAPRIRRMVEFAAALTKPDGVMMQIGDNDSGRFLPLRPPRPVLDPSEPIAAAAAVCGAADRREPAAALIASWIAPERVDDAPLAASILDSPVLAAPILASADAPVPVAPILDAASTAREAGASASCGIVLPGGAMEGARCVAFPDFGVYVLRSARVWLAVRCGGHGVIALAGHAHEDQLGVELQVDGVDILADPGTYVYTALPNARERFRSAAAHAVPQVEPPLRLARRGPTLFELHDRTVARCLRWDARGFAGELEVDGVRVRREIAIHGDTIRITDHVSGARRILPALPPRGAEHSPAYGVLAPAPDPPLRSLGGGRWEWIAR